MSDNDNLNANDIINKIHQQKGGNTPLFGKNFLSNIHDKVLNQMQGKNMPKQEKSGPQFDNRANNVINADMQMRTNVKELSEALLELGDAEIAKKLLTDHINILKEVLKQFSKK